MKYTAIFIFILLCFVMPVSAQKARKSTNGIQGADDVFKKMVDAGILSYSKPKHYKQLDTVTKVYRCGDYYIGAGSINTLVNKDSTIIILIGNHYGPRLLSKPDSVLNYKNGDLDYVNYMANKQVFTPIIYTKAYSSKKFNADYSGMYARKCSSTVEPRFTNNKIIFMGKGGYRFHLYYIYSNEFVEKIDEEIRKTIGFLKFKN